MVTDRQEAASQELPVIVEAENTHPLDWYPGPVIPEEREAWLDGEPTDSLALIDRARAALARAETLPDIGVVREVAERARRYASAAKLGRAAENHAARVRIEAERKAGALLAEMDRQRRGRPEKSEAIADLPPPKLTDLGVTYRQASDWQRIARVPDEVFEAHVEQVAKAGKPLTTDGVVQVARQIERERRRAEPKPIILPDDLPADISIGVADARDLSLADDTVHLIVTSPPYGVGIDEYEDGGDILAGDWPSFMLDWLTEAFRVAAPNGRLALNIPLDTTAGGYRPTYAQAVQMADAAGWEYRSTIVWVDDQLGKSTARGSVDSQSAPHIIAGAELVALFSKGDWRRDPPRAPDLDHQEWLDWTNGVWRFPGETQAWEGHPAPFPLKLPYRLIKLLSFPGDTVLDPFCGSGTTALAASRLNRGFLGFDRAPAYVEAARRRVAQDGRPS